MSADVVQFPTEPEYHKVDHIVLDAILGVRDGHGDMLAIAADPIAGRATLVEVKASLKIAVALDAMWAARQQASEAIMAVVGHEMTVDPGLTVGEAVGGLPGRLRECLAQLIDAVGDVEVER